MALRWQVLPQQPRLVTVEVMLRLTHQGRLGVLHHLVHPQATQTRTTSLICWIYIGDVTV